MTRVVRDTAERAWRMVGALEAIKEQLDRAKCMPSDRRTADLIAAARVVVEKAVIASWEYAGDLQILETATAEHREGDP